MRLISRVLIITSLVVLAGIASALGYRMVRADARLLVYEERIAELEDNYEALRTNYNEAVRETAITELHVNNGELCVRVRTVEGVQKTIDTPFDPAGEIYIDYVIRDGRVWIRRIFDASTAPSDALLIDPLFEEVDWSDADTRMGKAVYRSLSEGRWVVTVTGDGSLGLAKADSASGRADLVGAPRVREYEEVEEQVDARIRNVSPGDVWRALLGR